MTQPMTDVTLVLLGVGIITIIAVVIYLLESIGKCRHKWGDWHDDNTEEAYVQYRNCMKCGYTEREQWKKLK